MLSCCLLMLWVWHGKGSCKYMSSNTWVIFEGVPNIDHTSEVVTNDLKNWPLWVCTEVGFTCFCFDYAEGWGNGNLCFEKRAYVCVCTHFFLGHSTCVAITTMPFLQQSFENLMIYIQYPIFPSWRYNPKFVKAYIKTSKPRLAIGEYWSSCKYVGPMYVLDFDQGHYYWCWFIW